MKTGAQYRFSYKFSNTIKDILSDYFPKILPFIIALIFGLLLGIFICSNRAANIEIENFFNQTFIDYLSFECNNWALFFNNFIYVVMFSLVAILFNGSVLFIIFNILVCIFRGYILGFDTVCIITLFPILSLILAIIIYSIFILLANLIYCGICGISLKKYKEFKIYGSFCSKEKKSNYFKIQFLLILTIALVLLAQNFLIILVRATAIF